MTEMPSLNTNKLMLISHNGDNQVFHNSHLIRQIQQYMFTNKIAFQYDAYRLLIARIPQHALHCGLVWSYWGWQRSGPGRLPASGLCGEGGVRGWGMGRWWCILACNGADPPVDRILDTHFWKYYLAPTWSQITCLAAITLTITLEYFPCLREAVIQPYSCMDDSVHFI